MGRALLITLRPQQIIDLLVQKNKT